MLWLITFVSVVMGEWFGVMLVELRLCFLFSYLLGVY